MFLMHVGDCQSPKLSFDLRSIDGMAPPGSLVARYLGLTHHLLLLECVYSIKVLLT